MEKIKYSLLTLILLTFLFAGCSEGDKPKDEKDKKQTKEYWTCTMHPQVRMDGPGACPICGMDLIKKTEDIKEPAAGNDSDMVNMVTLTGKKQVLANVSTVMVSREKLNGKFQCIVIWILPKQAEK